jgi:RNA polymerase sigma-54 factor
MALTQRLQIRQSHALVMTQLLMQAIKLLQLSNLDLAAYVEAELERYPLLEPGSDGDSTPADRTGEAMPEPPVEDGAAPTAEFTGDSSSEDASESPLDDGSRDDRTPARPGLGDMPAGYSEWGAIPAGPRGDSGFDLESFLSAETTLADWLREQVTLAITDPVRRMIGYYLVDLVDESGYLAGDLAAAAERLGTGIAEIEAVLAVLQTFEPPGICARDLAECLAIQLKDRNRYDPAMAALIGRLDLVARRDFAALKKICGVGDDDLAEMIAEIRRLNPKPGLAFGSTVVQPIVPDVFVRAAPDGAWLVESGSWRWQWWCWRDR